MQCAAPLVGAAHAGLVDVSCAGSAAQQYCGQTCRWDTPTKVDVQVVTLNMDMRVADGFGSAVPGLARLERC